MNGFKTWLNDIVLQAFMPENILNTFGLSAFLHPAKRIYYPYLISALILAIAYFFYTKKRSGLRKTNFISYLFPKKIWGHKSALIDYKIFILNNLIKAFLIIPFVITNLAFAYIVIGWWENIIGIQDNLHWSKLNIGLTYTLVFMLVSDFSRFLLHFSLHKVSFLWQFHKVHHSAEVLTPMTLYRTHPIEVYLYKLRSILVFGLVAGSFSFWFRTSLDPVTILHIHIDVFLFNLIGSNLRHSHIPISFGRTLEHIFISPAQHQIHHSKNPKDFNKNLGSLFAIWDWLFKTLSISHSDQKLKYGIEEKEQNDYTTLWQNIWMPFKKLVNK